MVLLALGNLFVGCLLWTQLRFSGGRNGRKLSGSYSCSFAYAYSSERCRVSLGGRASGKPPESVPIEKPVLLICQVWIT
jgi:hypothetical protein